MNKFVTEILTGNDCKKLWCIEQKVIYIDYHNIFKNPLIKCTKTVHFLRIFWQQSALFGDRSNHFYKRENMICDTALQKIWTLRHFNWLILIMCLCKAFLCIKWFIFIRQTNSCYAIRFGFSYICTWLIYS